MSLAITSAAQRTIHGRSLSACLLAQRTVNPGSGDSTPNAENKQPAHESAESNPHILRMSDFLAKTKPSGA